MDLREASESVPDWLTITVKHKTTGQEYTDEAGALRAQLVYTVDEWDVISDVKLEGRNPTGLTPVDIIKLVTEPAPVETWLVEPILPRGRLIGLVSKRGEGKSLLALDLVANIAAGTPVLERADMEPENVIYLDLEMGPTDLYDRLYEFGWNTDHPELETLATHLHYYQLINLPPLDTPEGGATLRALIRFHEATVVVVDTVSRVISGDENAAEPFRDMFRHTETMLKTENVTLLRLDHLGKDALRGSRGSSAKEDPLDVVWHITDHDDTLKLQATKRRQSLVERDVTIIREYDNGILKHTMPFEIAPDWLTLLADNIERYSDVTQSQREVVKDLQKSHAGAKTTRVAAAMKYLRGKKGIVGNQTGNHLNTGNRESLRESDPDLGESTGNQGNRLIPWDPPSKEGPGGNQPKPDPY